MRKIGKQVISCLVAGIMMLGLSTNVSASTKDVNSVTINEYDKYVEIRSTSNQKLLDEGIDLETINYVKSNEIEERLSELSNLSEDDLYNMGYAPEQIEIIKNYSGERIENVPELRAAFADMTTSVSKVKASTVSLAIKYAWNWSKQPIFSGPKVEDIVGIDWTGSDKGGNVLNLAFQSASSFCDVYYCSNGDSSYTKKSYTVTNENSYNKASAVFPMSYYTGSGSSQVNHWAKKGSVIITVNRVGSKVINEGAFVFAYGHSTIFGSPSISLIPPGAGVAFSTGVDTMDKTAVRLTSTGVII